MNKTLAIIKNSLIQQISLKIAVIVPILISI
jgi:hypothetical protein